MNLSLETADGAMHLKTSAIDTSSVSAAGRRTRPGLGLTAPISWRAQASTETALERPAMKR